MRITIVVCCFLLANAAMLSVVDADPSYADTIDEFENKPSSRPELRMMKRPRPHGFRQNLDETSEPSKLQGDHHLTPSTASSQPIKLLLTLELHQPAEADSNRVAAYRSGSYDHLKTEFESKTFPRPDIKSYVGFGKILLKSI